MIVDHDLDSMMAIAKKLLNNGVPKEPDPFLKHMVKDENYMLELKIWSILQPSKRLSWSVVTSPS